MPDEPARPARQPRSRVPKPTLNQQIRDGLVELIVSGRLKPGERLVETRIAAEFGTSQAPVREALSELETLGLIENRLRRGRFVLPFVEQTIREAYVVRAALEETATRLAMLAGRVPFDLMSGDVEDMYRSATGQDIHALGLASTRFHRHLVDAGGNQLLKRAWEALQIDARTAIALVVLGPDPRHVAKEHEELLDVMRSGNVEAACLHAKEHQWAYADLPHDLHGRKREVTFRGEQGTEADAAS
jgi:DNA-binding GntR family transcriptional regulator